MNDTSSFASRLEEEKVTLEKELATVGRRNPSNPNDRADQMEHFGDNAAILTDLELRYADVLAALARIEAGTYGICEVSGEAIEPERLDADPTARTCKAHIK
jgi:RNA polymerase-binding transcription factor DksA